MINHFARNLRSKRLEFGWTQETAAKELSKKTKDKITEQRYQGWEHGRGEPDYNILIIISELFIIDDLYLFIKKPVRTKILHPQL